MADLPHIDFTFAANYAFVMVCTLLGTGTSHGIPVIGCDCRVCTSGDLRDTRFRASAYIQSGSTGILIDTGPEFRLQALKHRIRTIDAVLVTHSHADHIHGLDDLRIFSHNHPRHDDGQKPTTIYTTIPTIADIESRFSYIFKPVVEGGGKPRIRLVPCEGFTPESPLVIGGFEVVYVPMRHGSLTAAGWVLSERRGAKKHSIAYLTDCNAISDESIALIHRAACRDNPASTLDHAVLDGLRERPHSTHFSFDEALACAAKIDARHTWITHICHDKSHEEITAYFDDRKSAVPGQICPAYDGMKLEA
jgi:phosphoribosyl 1,2-cyclic phosphate phosphodiesterase